MFPESAGERREPSFYFLHSNFIFESTLCGVDLLVVVETKDREERYQSFARLVSLSERSTGFYEGWVEEREREHCSSSRQLKQAKGSGLRGQIPLIRGISLNESGRRGLLTFGYLLVIRASSVMQASTTLLYSIPLRSQLCFSCVSDILHLRTQLSLFINHQRT